ncbi:hypothetical protein KP509_03G010000 [Ceratopteris richardii]|uniref:K Homology domain-containing protein n=1 Tax=Ceratopteris richardii TaxID=49495 RepID=A0A8T2UX87_CERRI|nr:hypothetical protein KP509_03G010000 [Ceratopteris richardii]KAH7440769.1 hypothetical protein KP509_03G010000 [Ceratopteris richardii]
MLAMDSPRPPELTETCFPPSPPAAAAIPSSEHMKDVPAYIRFLISNAAAGSVIGKGGATINEFQSQSGARIQLSRNHEYFPGTSDRIIALHGTIQEVLTAFRLTLSKILNEAEKDAGHDNKSVKLIVPNAACGAIIGKGGATIKAFVQESKANIKLSPLDQNIPGVNDRIVTILGTLDQQQHAVMLIISKLAEDPNYSNFASASLSYPAYSTMAYGTPFYLQNGANGSFRTKGMASPLVQPISGVLAGGPDTSVTLPVADEHVGAIVGRGGKIITEIQQSTGARIKISDRGDYMPGTRNRTITITGTPEGTQRAQLLVFQRIQQNAGSDPER